MAGSNSNAVAIIEERTLRWIQATFCEVRKQQEATWRMLAADAQDCARCGGSKAESDRDMLEEQLRATARNIPLEGVPGTSTLVELFDAVTRRPETKAAIESMADDDASLWTQPALSELGAIQIAGRRASKTGTTIARAWPTDFRVTASIDWIALCEEPEPEPQPPWPCTMRYGHKWWTIFFYTYKKAWTRVRCSGKPHPAQFISVFMTASCSGAQAFRLAKLRNDESDVEIIVHDNQTLAEPCSKHRACLMETVCVSAGEVPGINNWDYL